MIKSTEEFLNDFFPVKEETFTTEYSKEIFKYKSEYFKHITPDFQGFYSFENCLYNKEEGKKLIDKILSFSDWKEMLIYFINEDIKNFNKFHNYLPKIKISEDADHGDYWAEYTGGIVEIAQYMLYYNLYKEIADKSNNADDFVIENNTFYVTRPLGFNKVAYTQTGFIRGGMEFTRDKKFGYPFSRPFLEGDYKYGFHTEFSEMKDKIKEELKTFKTMTKNIVEKNLTF